MKTFMVFLIYALLSCKNITAEGKSRHMYSEHRNTQTMYGSRGIIKTNSWHMQLNVRTFGLSLRSDS